MLQDLANISTIIQAVFVAISLYFIWREVRENTRLARAANVQSLVELSSPLNLQLVQDRQMAEFWVLGPEKFAEMDQVDKYRYHSMIVWWLILHENIYYQHEKKLLDDSAYAAWENDLDQFVVEQKLGQHWDDVARALQADFKSHLQAIIQKHHVMPALAETKL